MALPMLLGTAAKGLAKGSGRAVASNIMGRKKKVKPSAIAPRQGAQGQQQGQRKGSALVKSPTTAITKAMAPIQKVSTGPVAKGNYLGVISEKLLQLFLSFSYKVHLKQQQTDHQKCQQPQKLLPP